VKVRVEEEMTVECMGSAFTMQSKHYAMKTCGKVDA
jgi:hypothetical protein